MAKPCTRPSHLPLDWTVFMASKAIRSWAASRSRALAVAFHASLEMIKVPITAAWSWITTCWAWISSASLAMT